MTGTIFDIIRLKPGPLIENFNYRIQQNFPNLKFGKFSDLQPYEHSPMLSYQSTFFAVGFDVVLIFFTFFLYFSNNVSI